MTLRDDGAWMLPLFLCRTVAGTRWTGSHDVAAVGASPDRGASWDLVEVPESTGCVHMTLVPLGDGAHRRLLPRRQADFVYRTESSDGGRTWSRPSRRTFRTTIPRSWRSRSRDGRVALLCNPINAAQSQARRESLYDELGEVDDGRADPTGGVAAIWGVPRAR